jgi:phosphohistidine phosphatase
MPTLILFRHAKAAPALRDQSDFDRPLTERGRRDAERMGVLLTGRPIDLALVSAAVRTRETFDIATASMRPAPSADIERDLYLCGARKLVRRLTAIPPKVETLMVVGHNPDMQEVALWLAGEDESPESLALRHKFPTAAFAIFNLDLTSWKELGPKRASLKRFAIPSELED